MLSWNCRHLRIALLASLVACSLPLLFGRPLLADDAAPPNASARGVLCLAASPPQDDVPDASLTLLVRELARQAVLISAREELNLATRDMVLRESFPEQETESIKILEIDTAHAPGKFLRVRLRKQGSGDLLLEREIPLTDEAPHEKNYPAIIEAVEALSREQFVETLKSAGLGASAESTGAFSADDVEPHLRKLNLWSQFATLRRLHAMDDADNARLGYLVRAYANLGLMSEYYWNAAHKVYKARALLYGQRLVQRDPDSPSSYWHRAYARALSGLHKLALDDLESAATLAEQANTNPPEWVDLVRNLCLYQTAPLRAAALNSSDHGELAAMFAYVTSESSSSRSTKLKLGREMLERAPDCLRIYDAMSAEMELANLHFLTVAGPQALVRSLSEQLPGVPGLPESVASSVVELQEKLKVEGGLAGPQADVPTLLAMNPGLCERLRAAGEAGHDVGEPSLAAIGSTIEDVTFLQLSRRTYFMFRIWGVPVDDFVSQAMPLIAKYPYRVMLESMTSEILRDKQKYEQLVKNLNIVDAEPQEWAMMGLAAQPEPAGLVQGKGARQLAIAHTDPTAYELEHMMSKGIEQKRHKEFAHALLAASPHSPYAMGILIQSDWSFAEPRLAAWRAEHGDQPSLLGPVAWQLIHQQNIAEAKTVLEKQIQSSDDAWPFLTLAGIYLREKDYAKWQATLDQYLATSERSLKQVSVQVELADHFVDRGEIEKARPYAEAAAELGSFDGIACLVRLHEAAGELDKAEPLVAYLAERYPSSLPYRYYWIKRTGRGDEQAALKAAKDYLQAFGERATTKVLSELGYIGVLTGDNKLARQSFETLLQNQYSPYHAMLLALACDAEGDHAARDKWIASIVDFVPKLSEKDKNARLGGIAAARLIQAALAGGEQAALNPQEVYATSDMIKSQREWINFYCFVGRFDELHGHAAQARQWYEQSVRANNTQNECHLLSMVRLRELESLSPGDSSPTEKSAPDGTSSGLIDPPRRSEGLGTTIYLGAGILLASVCVLGLALVLHRAKRAA